jgi:hypothetical protein
MRQERNFRNLRPHSEHLWSVGASIRRAPSRKAAVKKWDWLRAETTKTLEKSAVAKVPVPIFSQPLRGRQEGQAEVSGESTGGFECDAPFSFDESLEDGRGHAAGPRNGVRRLSSGGNGGLKPENLTWSDLRRDNKESPGSGLRQIMSGNLAIRGSYARQSVGIRPSAVWRRQLHRTRHVRFSGSWRASGRSPAPFRQVRYSSMLIGPAYSPDSISSACEGCVENSARASRMQAAS